MERISSCSSCGNNRSGQSAKKCAKCGTITCQKCSFTGCSCGSKSYSKQFTIS